MRLAAISAAGCGPSARFTSFVFGVGFVFSGALVVGHVEVQQRASDGSFVLSHRLLVRRFYLGIPGRGSDQRRAMSAFPFIEPRRCGRANMAAGAYVSTPHHGTTSTDQGNAQIHGSRKASIRHSASSSGY